MRQCASYVKNCLTATITGCYYDKGFFEHIINGLPKQLPPAKYTNKREVYLGGRSFYFWDKKNSQYEALGKQGYFKDDCITDKFKKELKLWWWKN